MGEAAAKAAMRRVRRLVLTSILMVVVEEVGRKVDVMFECLGE
jgi:predicted unusual protein kinase regulating ubiquinone biosynthesis (AarF/ABC1/UbiB family)